MNETLTTRFFDETWLRENARDIERARQLTAEARRKLAAMTREEFIADAVRTIAEADQILRLLAGEN